MKIDARVKDNRGFTLIETLIALVLIEIGVLGLMSLFGMVSQGNRYAQEHTDAGTLAEAKIEDLRIGGFASLSNGTFSDSNNPVDAHGNSGGVYTRTWSISTFGGQANIKQVTVSIDWRAGQNHIEMSSLLSPTL